MGKSGTNIMAKLSKNICGIYVYSYPCWEKDIDYTQDTSLIVEYGEHLYFNEKRIDIGFDNTLYIRGLQPPNNPIFRLKELVWRSVTATTAAIYELGQRMVTTNPNTSELVYFVSRGRGSRAPYTGTTFNVEYYHALTGETTNACSFFNPVSCATWEDEASASVTSDDSGTETEVKNAVESMSSGVIDFTKSVQTRTTNITPFTGSF